MNDVSADVLQAYEVRDNLLGDGVECNIAAALKLAEVCSHPEAKWIHGVFANSKVSTKEEARTVLLRHSADPRALAFSVLLKEDWTLDDGMRKAAEQGNAFAQAVVAMFSEGEERIENARKSAAQNERNGLFIFGIVCKNELQDKDRSIENLRAAARLKHGLAAMMLVDMFELTSPERWFWLGQLAKKEQSSFLLRDLKALMEEKQEPSKEVWESVGRALSDGHVSTEKLEIFGRKVEKDLLFFAHKAVEDLKN